MAWPADLKAGWSPLYEWLRVVRRRPGQYLGGGNLLEALSQQIAGYRLALGIHGRTDPLLDALQGTGFTDYAAGRLDLPGRYDGETVFKMIAYISPAGGRVALDLDSFCELLDGFLVAQDIALPEATLMADMRRERSGGKPGSDR